MANQFVRVRLTRIDNVDLNLFEFDYDLTMMIFFLDADANVYARYGGRDARDADNRQSLDGLKYTMQSVLAMHRSKQRSFAPKTDTKEKYIREVTGGGGRGCMHCHQVKEALNRQMSSDGTWTRDAIFRYPLPENLGMRLEVNRGNIVERVTTGTPAASAGLKRGDRIERIGSVPIHSFGDAQYALDKAPKTGSLEISWRRNNEKMSGELALNDGWRRTDVSWRTSMRRLIAHLPLYGTDLSAAERKGLSLSPTQLAFRQNSRLQSRAKDAGFMVGDIIVDMDDRKLQMNVDELLRHVEQEYLAGDNVTFTVIRNGQTMKLPIVLRNR